jgi:glycosyltransferase involved in cell wall biosynthesis
MHMPRSQGLRILVLHHDGFGGRGGIAKFNRDLLTALASHPASELVTALPRLILDPVERLPTRLEYRRAAARGKAWFLASELALLTRRCWYDLVVCGHLRLLPLVLPLLARGPARLGLVLHGIEAWEASGGALTRRLLAKIDWFLAVSGVTSERFLAWSRLPAARGFVLPNSVDLARFRPGARRAELVARYGLAGRRVIMGLGRLDTRERAKGFDEVIEAMPALVAKHPDLVYLLCGEGTDRPRLEAKARAAGIGERVVFAGYVDEAEKVDHYRLADCFVLAGWYEGFGIALLEAMACGVPAVASSLDGSREAVGDGRLGIVVNPREQGALVAGIEAALARQPGAVPAGLAAFSYEAFEARVHRLVIDPLLARRTA